jgi:hypothetical protein
MTIQLAGRRLHGHVQVLEERLTRWCTSAKYSNRLRFLKVTNCSHAAPGKLSGAMIRV